MAGSLAYLAAYAVIAGFASFIEVRVGRGFKAFQLNSLIRVGSLVAALIAFLAVHGLSVRMTTASLAGLGVGLVAGVGSICYCFAVGLMPINIVATLSNLYLVVTTALGIVVLGESITVLKVAGLAATIAGALLLENVPERFGVQGGGAAGRMASLGPLLIMTAYIVIVGVSAFLEKPLLRSLDPVELNAVMAVGMTAVAVVALAMRGPALPMQPRTLLPVGVGVMLGVASVLYFLALRGLPVFIAAALSNASVLVTIALSTVVLKQSVSGRRGVAIALTLVGLTLLAISVA